MTTTGALNPAAATTADDLCVREADPCTVSTRVAVSDRSSINLGSRALVVAAGGRLDVGGGSMNIAARAVAVEPGGQLLADGSNAQGGTIKVDAREEITIAGVVRANGTNGGVVSLAAAGTPGTLSVTGSIAVDGTAGSGYGGDLELAGTELIISGALSATGRNDGLGGSINLTADRDVVIDSNVNANAGDAGDITVVAGDPSGGNLQLLAGAALTVNGTSPGGSGGSIDLTALGDGVDAGHVTLNGIAEAQGGSGEDDGGDGGDIVVTAAGDLTGVAGRGSYDARGGAPDGLAGEVSLTALGSIDLQRRLSAQGSGTEGIGGDISVDAGVNLSIATKLSVSGSDDGGVIDLSVDRGLLEVLAGAVIDASGTIAGYGGEVKMNANAASSSVVIKGRIFANGSPSPGDGGRVEITAAGTLTVSGPPAMAGGLLQAQGGNGGGSGGTIMLSTTGGDLQVAGTASAVGFGRLSRGGLVALASGNGLLVSGTLDATGEQLGGQIGLEASGSVMVDGQLVAMGTGGSGGRIEVRSDDEARIGGTLTADATGDAQADEIRIEACTVRIEREGILHARGDGGHNRLVGHESVAVFGELLASANDIVYRNPQDPPVLDRANVVPAPTLVLDEGLVPCQVEPPVRCDVNGDGRADASDLESLETELFDGDGDRVADVHSGTFAGRAGADANVDGRITTADLTRCVELIAGSSLRF